VCGLISLDVPSSTTNHETGVTEKGKMLKYLLFAASGVAAFIPAFPNPYPSLACPGNTPDDRASWCKYNLTTDWYTTVPYTGVTREYF
jgi:hypothetical protein